MLYSVRSLLELPDLPDDVRYLKQTTKALRRSACHCVRRVLSAPTILILEKLTRPSSVKFGVPSSIKAKSVRYIPRYGTQGGLQLGEPSVEIDSISKGRF